jgi:hypothetical protein
MTTLGWCEIMSGPSPGPPPRAPSGQPRERGAWEGAVRALLPGLLIILVGIVLFWASTRRTLSERARMFLEGQASVTVPAGLAALGVGAWKRHDGNGK